VSILEEPAIIEKLIELDARALEINKKRRNQLKFLASRYKEEEQEIVNNYNKQIEEETREITKKIVQEAQQEINQMKLKNKEILKTMEQDFENSLKDITDEIMRQIFQFSRENNG